MADYPVTLSSTRISPLSTQEESATGFNTKFKILYSDIAVATSTVSTDTVTVTLAALPANWFINAGAVVISTVFAGTGGLALTVGPTTSAAALISSTSVLTKATLNQTVGTPIMTNLKATATANLTATFTNSVSGSPSAFTAGELDIYVNIQDVAKLP